MYSTARGEIKNKCDSAEIFSQKKLWQFLWQVFLYRCIFLFLVRFKASQYDQLFRQAAASYTVCLTALCTGHEQFFNPSVPSNSIADIAKAGGGGGSHDWPEDEKCLWRQGHDQDLNFKGGWR